MLNFWSNNLVHGASPHPTLEFFFIQEAVHPNAKYITIFPLLSMGSMAAEDGRTGNRPLVRCLPFIVQDAIVLLYTIPAEGMLGSV